MFIGIVYFFAVVFCHFSCRDKCSLCNIVLSKPFQVRTVAISSTIEFSLGLICTSAIARPKSSNDSPSPRGC